MPAASESRAAALTLTGLAAATLLAWANLWQGGFQFDDFEVVLADARVQDLRAWWQGMPGMRPLLKLSYALNHQSGFGLAGFQTVNLLIHLGNGLLSFALLLRLFRRHDVAPAAALWAAGAATAIFLLHPVQTEAVTYVSGRSTSLCSLLALASILTWLRGRETGRRLWLYGLSPLLFLAALATKEMAAMVPLVLLLWEWTDPVPGAATAALRRTGVHWLLLAAVLMAALGLPAYQRFLATSLAERDWLENLLAQPEAIAWLTGQLLRFDQLNADPALRPTLGPVFLLAVTGLLVAVLAALASRRRRPLLAFSIGWFLLWLAPTNSLLARLDLVNDRQLYLALLGPALLVGLGVAGLARQRTLPALVVTVALTMLLGTATHLRNRVYVDEVSFWTDVTRKSPHNARAFNNLGMGLAVRCDLTGAEAAWQEALRLDPAYVRAAVNLRLLQEGALPAGLGPCPD